MRSFGRLQLLALLGKSERTMAWRAADPRTGRELMLVLPRVQPDGAAALERWQQAVRQAARLDHPQLAAVAEIGTQDGWPFVAYDPLGAPSLAERTAGTSLPGLEAARLTCQLLQGLAMAHDGGVAHHDVQPYLVLVGDDGTLRLAGLAVAAEMACVGERTRSLAAVDPGALRAQRAAAERDVLAAGVLLHTLIAAKPALDEPDVGRVIARLPPQGREVLRLPWTGSQPVSEPLRAIVNRATERQERQRYRSARTMLGALEGWHRTVADAGGGPLALLAERMGSTGVLPSSPGSTPRVARLAKMERQRTSELAEVVLEDLALSFELLRLVNSAQVRGAQISGGGPVLTVRRAIAMIGMEGVRRAAAALREWPGPLDEEGAAELQRLIRQCKRAGRAALMLRPAAYDGEVVYLITLMQNLGRLVVHYHFASEAQQIRRLMQPAPSALAGGSEDHGMSEEAAAHAVLGTDIESIGAAVARHWGLDEAVLTMIRREPLATPVRGADTDDAMLRLVASCANEAVDALAQPPAGVVPALQRIALRYGRVLGISLRDLQAALQGVPAAPISVTTHAPLDEVGS